MQFNKSLAISHTLIFVNLLNICHFLYIWDFSISITCKFQFWAQLIFKLFAKYGGTTTTYREKKKKQSKKASKLQVYSQVK